MIKMRNRCLYCNKEILNGTWCSVSHKQMYYNKLHEDKINNTDPDRYVEKILNDTPIPIKNKLNTVVMRKIIPKVKIFCIFVNRNPALRTLELEEGDIIDIKIDVVLRKNKGSE